MRIERALLVAVVLVGCEACARESVPPPAVPGASSSSDEEAPSPTGPPAQPVSAPPAAILARAELAALDADACHALLRSREVAFEVIDAEDARNVHAPIRLRGPVGGITVAHGGRSERHEIMDCRLAVSLLGWAPALREAGFERIEHMSIYRPGARVRSTGRASGHDAGTAIDVFFFIRPDGTRLEVERDWADKTRGSAPCPPREDEPEAEHVLRTLVCNAVAADLFQVVVTPHGDARHHNHVHLEIRPEVEWTHVR